MAQSILPKEVDQKAKKTKILVVDDDKGTLGSFVRLLERSGFEVDSAETGKGALDKISLKKYNVVLLDFRLPDIDGLEVAHKARGELKDTIKIMITGYPSKETAIKAVDEGIYAYTTKPVDPQDLLLIITTKLKEKDLKPS